MPLVITEKVDGSNLCLTRERVFARTHAHAPRRHASFDMAKATWASLAPRIPAIVSVFGEWTYARHSIGYERLPDYLLLIAVREDKSGTWWSWERTCELALTLGVPTVPQLWAGKVSTEQELVRVTQEHARAASDLGASEREGVVVRWSNAFGQTQLHGAMAKWVRAGHLKTDDHWTSRGIIRNQLAH